MAAWKGGCGELPPVPPLRPPCPLQGPFSEGLPPKPRAGSDCQPVRLPPWDQMASPPTNKTHSLHVCLSARLSWAPAEGTLREAGGKALPQPRWPRARRLGHDSQALAPGIRPLSRCCKPGGQEQSGACRGLGARGPTPVLTSLAAATLGAFRCRQLVAACWGRPGTRAHPPGTPWCPQLTSVLTLTPTFQPGHSQGLSSAGPAAEAAWRPEAHALLTVLATSSGS